MSRSRPLRSSSEETLCAGSTWPEMAIRRHAVRPSAFANFYWDLAVVFAERPFPMLRKIPPRQWNSMLHCPAGQRGRMGAALCDTPWIGMLLAVCTSNLASAAGREHVHQYVTPNGKCDSGLEILAEPLRIGRQNCYRRDFQSTWQHSCSPYMANGHGFDSYKSENGSIRDSDH